MTENKSLYQEWIDRSEDQSDFGQYQVFMKKYYDLETEAYRKILEAYPEKPYETGTFADLQEELGFGSDDVIFMGFLDGVNESLKTPLDLEEITKDSELKLDIDFPTLLYNMHKAKAKWLFGLKEWSNVMTDEERLNIQRKYRDDSTLHVEKIGRNDPCPCGSGKKYKKCHGR